MLSDTQRQQVRELLDDMAADVRLVYFSQAFGCDTCADTKRILDLLAEIPTKVTIEEKNLVIDTDDAARYGVAHAPAIVVLGVGADGALVDHGIRLLGAPFGYEFTSLMDAILARLAAEAAPDRRKHRHAGARDRHRCTSRCSRPPRDRTVRGP